MRIHALSTGTVRVKDAFLHARSGPTRQVRLFTPGPFSDPLPVHAWVVEHDGQRILVDTGEVATAHDAPFARFSVDPSEELPGALAAAGFAPPDIDQVVLTHLHADHMDGAVHVDRPVLVHEAEWAYAHTLFSRFFQRVLKQPLPEGVEFRRVPLDGGPFGAFAASRPLTGDGRVVMVATPGHTPGHVSVVCIDDDGRHVLLAGDATDTLEQLHDRRPDGVAPKPKVQVDTIERILAQGVSTRPSTCPRTIPSRRRGSLRRRCSEAAPRSRRGSRRAAPASTGAPRRWRA